MKAFRYDAEENAEDIILYKTATNKLNTMHESVLRNIMSYLGDQDLLNLRECSKDFLAIVKHRDVVDKRIECNGFDIMLCRALLSQNLELLCALKLSESHINKALAYCLLTHKNTATKWLLVRKTIDPKAESSPLVRPLHMCKECFNCMTCAYNFMHTDYDFQLNKHGLLKCACAANNLEMVKYLINNLNIQWKHLDVRTCYYFDAIDVLEFFVKEKGYKITFKDTVKLIQRLGIQGYWHPLIEMLGKGLIKLGAIYSSYFMYYCLQNNANIPEVVYIVNNWGSVKLNKALLKQSFHHGNYSMVKCILNQKYVPTITQKHFRALERNEYIWQHHLDIELMLVNRFEMQKKLALCLQ